MFPVTICDPDRVGSASNLGAGGGMSKTSHGFFHPSDDYGWLCMSIICSHTFGSFFPHHRIFNADFVQFCHQPAFGQWTMYFPPISTFCIMPFLDRRFLHRGWRGWVVLAEWRRRWWIVFILCDNLALDAHLPSHARRCSIVTSCSSWCSCSLVDSISTSCCCVWFDNL